MPKTKLQVLADNNTYMDEYFLGEPAVSYCIEDAGEKILFDTGYSELFMRNAVKMGIDLTHIDTVVFSHGHNDHTGGFPYLAASMDLSQVKVVAHPLCFYPKYDGMGDIGSPLQTAEVRKMCDLRLSKVPLQISDHLVFLGEIPNLNEFEVREKIGAYQIRGEWFEDTVLDDSALVYRSEKGLFIITGCSHSGVCNIMEYAKEVCHTEQIVGVIGGFHLFETDWQLDKTIEYFENNHVEQLYPCHCVSFQAKAKINEKIRVNEVGVGLTLTL